jgi:hypothetical protein
MCDRYSPHYGYICHECFDELVASGLDTGIEDFMNSKKGGEPEMLSPEQYFSDVFPKSDDK